MKEFAIKYKLQIIIFLLAFGVYANTINHDYAWDDAIVITGNERVQKGFEGIPSLFKNYKSEEVSGTYGYRPIVLTSFALEVGLFGLNPKVSHFNNVLLYALLCLLIYSVLLLIFSSEKWKLCFLITLIYAVHPIHTEVVANIKSRDEIMAFIFGLLAIRYFIKSINSSAKFLNLLKTLALLLMAFLCKESSLLFVPLMFLIALYTSHLSIKSILKTTVICILFTLAIIGLWKLSISSFLLEDNSVELVNKGIYQQDGFLTNPVKALESKSRVMVEGIYLLGRYVGLYLYPNPLLHDYAYNQIPKITGPNPYLVTSFLSLIGFLIYFLATLKKRTIFKFGVLFFLFSIFGYLHVVMPGKDLFAERFMFVPSLGLSIVFVQLILLLSSKIKMMKTKHTFFLIGLIVFILGSLTLNRNSAWKNNKTLFETDIVHMENNTRANFNYASYLESKFENGVPLESQANLKQVINLYTNCIRISDKSYQAYVKLGSLYMALGEHKKARSLFEKLASLNYKLSEPFFLLGKYYLTRGDYTLALEQFKISKQNGSAMTDNYYYISICYLKLKLIPEAIQILNEGEKFKPKTQAYFALQGDLNVFNADTVEALISYNKALQIAPNNKDIQNKISLFSSN